MGEMLYWLYLANAALLITHEIDSAYWKEWNLFGFLFGRPSGYDDDRKPLAIFLLCHIPAAFLVVWGASEVVRGSTAGTVMSLVLAGGGIFAFTVHMIFMARGRDEFRAPVSVLILVGTLLVSLGQIAAFIART
jgi:hypothetical protein